MKFIERVRLKIHYFIVYLYPRHSTDVNLKTVKLLLISKNVIDIIKINLILICRPSDKSNPVLELQLKGKQYQSGYADEDDPPYNFQVSCCHPNLSAAD